MGIYAALGIPEIWRYDGDIFGVFTLASKGRYRRAAKSRAFPALPIEAFARFIAELGSRDETTLLRSFQEWLREESRKRTPKELTNKAQGREPSERTLGG